jgi:L-seryl-tRNA(Ser) seleniumtransferase
LLLRPAATFPARMRKRVKTMKINSRQQDLLRKLPGVDRILEKTGKDSVFKEFPKSVLVDSSREVIEDLRRVILYDSEKIAPSGLDIERIIQSVHMLAAAKMTPNLKRTINATGIVVHTNLGRSLLGEAIVENIKAVSTRYSNLEFDLAKGVRGSRYSAVEGLLCEMTGAEAALAVNNNAGAVLLCLDTVAHGREVIVSRGELIEIGGSFRIPDVMAKSGGILREVGTTNRTHLKDYENAIGDRTGLLLKVHTSNYAIVGFTAGLTLPELVDLGHRCNLPVMEDLGSGTLIDFSGYGLPPEPTVQDSVKAGVDLITFSGDKLLGGPQAGMIVGRRDLVEQIKTNPLTRALRIDKLTLAALESTLRLYRDEKTAIDAIPTLRLLTTPKAVIERRADRLSTRLSAGVPSEIDIKLLHRSSKAGGGSMPLLELPSVCVGIHIPGLSANTIENHMRASSPPVIGRIEDDMFLMDLRTVQDDEIEPIGTAFDNLLARASK